MSTPELLGLRLRAWRERRAIPSRRTFSLLPDPEGCLGIVPIRTSGDRRLVAAAYGHPDHPPQLLFRPLGDQDPGREPLLALLEALESVMGEADHCPRVWVPHRDALVTLDPTKYQQSLEVRKPNTKKPKYRFVCWRKKSRFRSSAFRPLWLTSTS